MAKIIRKFKRGVTLNKMIKELDNENCIEILKIYEKDKETYVEFIGGED